MHFMYLEYGFSLEEIGEGIPMMYYLGKFVRLLVVSLCLITSPLLVSAAARDDLELDHLLKLSLEDLLDIKISTPSKFTETAMQAPGIVSVVTKREIEAFGANSLFEILNRVTSVYMLGSYGYPQNFISIRGDNVAHFNQRVLLLINGRPFRDSTFGGTDSVLLLAFPIGAIDRLEVVRGPGSVLYGSNAVDGVINVITKNADEFDSKAVVTVGSFSTKAIELAVGGASGAVNATGAVYGFTERGWRFEALDEAGATVSTDYGEDNLAGFTRVEYKNISLNAFIGRSREDQFGVVPLLPIVERTQNRYFIDLGVAQPLSEAWRLNLNVTYNRLDHEVPSDGVPPTPTVESLSESSLLEISAKYAPTDDLNFILGAVADYHRGSIGPALPVKIDEYSEWWYQGYAQVSYWPISSLKFIGGLQWNLIEGLDGELVPRVGAIYNFDSAWGVKLLYGQAYRGAYPLERAIEAGTILRGNPNLKPETVETTEAQLFYHARNVEAGLTLFNVRQEDLVNRVMRGSTITFVNENELKFRGVELEGKYSLDDRFYFTGSVSYQENENESGVEKATLIPSTLWKMGFSYNVSPAFTASLFNTYVSAATDNVLLNPNRAKFNPKADAYNALSVNLAFDVNKLLGWSDRTNMSFSIYGTNLLDEDINTPEFGRKNVNTFPLAAGRAGYAKLGVSF